MTRAILISVLVSMLFAGLEGATDAAGPGIDTSQENGHEMHGPPHVESHEHEGDDHFCHCGVHAVALLTSIDISVSENQSVSHSRYDDRFSSLLAPPLLRPPNS